jgi:hypothetical protein
MTEILQRNEKRFDVVRRIFHVRFAVANMLMRKIALSQFSKSYSDNSECRPRNGTLKRPSLSPDFAHLSKSHFRPTQHGTCIFRNDEWRSYKFVVIRQTRCAC